MNFETMNAIKIFNMIFGLAYSSMFMSFKATYAWCNQLCIIKQLILTQCLLKFVLYTFWWNPVWFLLHFGFHLNIFIWLTRRLFYVYFLCNNCFHLRDGWRYNYFMITTTGYDAMYMRNRKEKTMTLVKNLK